MAATSCALCRRPGVSERVDITFGEINPRDVSDFAVLSVVRGMLVCRDCMASRSLADVFAASGSGIGVLRGCLVQCTGRAPWWLRMSMPGGPRVWNKATCPSCGGRASVQPIWHAEADKRPGAIRQGFRDALSLFRMRGAELEGDNADEQPATDGNDPGSRTVRVVPAAAPVSELPDTSAQAGAGMGRVPGEQARPVIGSPGWQQSWPGAEYEQ